MPNIPTIPGTAQIQTQGIGVKRDPTQQLRALGAVRGTIGAAQGAIDQSMSVVAEYEEKKRKAEEAYVFNSSSLSFQKLHTDYQHGIKKMPDEQIVPTWTDQAQAWKQGQIDQYDGKLSPRAKKLLNMNLDNAIGGATAGFQVMADHLASQRREDAAVANWAEFLKTGDPDKVKPAMASLKIAKQAGDITPEKYAYYESQVPQVLQKNQILNGIDHDAFATLKSIKDGKYKDVPETELSTLRNTAEKQVAFTQRTTSSDFINDFQATGIPKSDRELQDSKQKGDVTGEFVKNYKAMVERRDYHDAQDKQALMLNKLRDLDLSDSDNPEKAVREITDESASLPPQLQKEIHTLGDSKIKAAKTAEAKTIHSDQLDLMQQSFDESQGRVLLSPRGEDGPAHWAEGSEALEQMPDAQLKDTFGDDADRKELVKAAKQTEANDRLRYARAQKSYVTWSKTKKGAEATPEQAAAERERLGFGRYSTTDDVAASYKAGKIDRGTAKEVLRRQFGIP